MKSFTKNSIVSSLILFALSTVIGITPLAITLTHYHLQLSNSNEKQQRAKRLDDCGIRSSFYLFNPWISHIK